MTKKDFGDFKALVEEAVCLTAVSGEKDVGRTAASMFRALEEFPFAVVRDAFVAHCRQERFFPTLADIATRIEGKAEERAALAWALVMRAVRRLGASKSVRFPSPAIHYALEQMGGWRHFASSLTTNEEPFRAKDFALFYSIGERIASWDGVEGTRAVPPYLQREIEHDNRGNDFIPRRVYDAEALAQIPERELPPPASRASAPALIRETVQALIGNTA